MEPNKEEPELDPCDCMARDDDAIHHTDGCPRWSASPYCD